MMRWKYVSNMLTLALLLVGTSPIASFCSSSCLKTSTHKRHEVLYHPAEIKKHSHTNRCIALKSAVEKSDTTSLSKLVNPSSAQKTIIKDAFTIFLHASFCIVSATILSFYEGYDCAYLKPQAATIRNFPTSSISNGGSSDSLEEKFLLKHRTWETRGGTAVPTIIDIMNTGTRGMGRGQIDRLDGWYQNTYFGYNENEEYDDPSSLTSSSNAHKKKRKFSFNYFTATIPTGENNGMVSQNHMREIPSYNEIMEEHRLHQVPTWRRDNPSSINSNNNNMDTASDKVSSPSPRSLSISSQEQQQQDMGNAVGSVYRALQAINQLKLEANDYNWDKMKALLETPTLRKDLLDGCSVLRGAVGILDDNARMEIGFDWGSCAWRHCGATADAQESLAELYNNAGMLEPFECLFTLDIVERSLRDILAVVPPTYHPVGLRNTLKVYVPYQQINTNGYTNDEEGSSTIDDKFVSTLSGLRKNY